LRLLDEPEAEEPEASPFFRSCWRASHYSSVKRSLPPMVTGSEGGSCSWLSTALRRPITSSIDSSEKSSDILIAMATYEYFLGTMRRNFSIALSLLMSLSPYHANCYIRVLRRRVKSSMSSPGLKARFFHS